LMIVGVSQVGDWASIVIVGSRVVLKVGGMSAERRENLSPIGRLLVI
jgi:hypothetical protein